MIRFTINKRGFIRFKYSSLNRNLRNLGQDHENPEKVSIASADKTIGINGVILTQESEVLEITDIRLGNQKKRR